MTEGIMKVHRDIPGVEYWYDPHMRCWYSAPCDEEGNLADSQNAYTKSEIIEIAKAQAEWRNDYLANPDWKAP
jgi:hypothetical protein